MNLSTVSSFRFVGRVSFFSSGSFGVPSPEPSAVFPSVATSRFRFSSSAAAAAFARTVATANADAAAAICPSLDA